MRLQQFIAVAALVSLAACGPTTYQATDTKTLVVPDVATRDFLQQYPNSRNVVWTYYDPNVVVINEWELTGWEPLDASDYAVRFDMDNEPYYAWYDSEGNWIGTAYVVRDYSTLPAMINTTISRRYPVYTITNANREYYKDRKLYEVTLKKDDTKVVLLMDENGTVVKEKVKYGH